MFDILINLCYYRVIQSKEVLEMAKAAYRSPQPLLDYYFNPTVIEKAVAGYDRFKSGMSKPDFFKVVIYDHSLNVIAEWDRLHVSISWLNTSSGVRYPYMRNKVLQACKKWSKKHGFSEIRMVFDDKRNKKPYVRLYDTGGISNG